MIFITLNCHPCIINIKVASALILSVGSTFSSPNCQGSLERVEFLSASPIISSLKFKLAVRSNLVLQYPLEARSEQSSPHLSDSCAVGPRVHHTIALATWGTPKSQSSRLWHDPHASANVAFLGIGSQRREERGIQSCLRYGSWFCLYKYSTLTNRY